MGCVYGGGAGGNVGEEVGARYTQWSHEKYFFPNLLTCKLRVYCPQMQHVKQILLSKDSTLIAAFSCKDTHCAVCGYPPPLALFGGPYFWWDPPL